MTCDIATLLLEAASRHAARCALVFDGRRYTYAELVDNVAAWGGWLGARSNPGDRVAVIARNSADAVIALLAAMGTGRVAVPLHPDTPPARLTGILQDCGASVTLTDDTSAMTELPVQITRFSTVVEETRRAAGEASLAAAPDDVGAIFYTSGSTRTPRGVTCRHRQITFCIDAINRVIGNSSDDVILSGRPLSFDYGFYQVLLALAAGARLVLTGNVAIATTLPRLVEQERVTGLPIVPSVLGALLQARVLRRATWPTLRYVTSTGDVLPPAHIAALQAALPRIVVMPMYGLTECKRVSIMPPGLVEGREASVGLPLGGTSVRVVGDDGQNVTVGELGELWVRGPHLTDGYWGDPMLTRERFVTDTSTGVLELRTGDLFRQDSDGFLYFVSRGDTIIKVHGERVGACEVEAVLGECPGVVEAVVVGIPGGLSGDAIIAFVVVDSTGTSIRALQQHCAQHLPTAARPARFVCSANLLPRTPNGKIDRGMLRRDAAALAHQKC